MVIISPSECNAQSCLRVTKKEREGMVFLRVCACACVCVRDGTWIRSACERKGAGRPYIFCAACSTMDKMSTYNSFVDKNSSPLLINCVPFHLRSQTNQPVTTHGQLL